MSINNGFINAIALLNMTGYLSLPQVRALSNSFAEKDGAPLSWRTDQRYSGLNIGVLGIFYEPLQRCAGLLTFRYTTALSLCPCMLEAARLCVASPASFHDNGMWATF